MLILHTSDWHLGRTLEGRSRQPEHEKFVDEICDIVVQEKVDLVLVTGDVFDSVNPPALAEDLYYDALARLSDQGRRAVVVIAGNHDNPERLCAVRPLADRNGITLFGYPTDDPGELQAPPGRVARPQAGPGWAEIGVPGVDHSAVILALPYPSESRLHAPLTDTLDTNELQKAYSQLVEQWFLDRSCHYRPDTVRIAASHLYVAGGLETPDSERDITMGGAYAVSPSALPPSAQYVALGHLHRAQRASANGTVARYAGSPLALSFSEEGQAKSVTLVAVAPAGAATAVREIPLSAGKPLVTWRATGGLAQLEQWESEGRDAHAWVNVEVHVSHPLTPDEVQRVRSRHPGIVQIRPVLVRPEEPKVENGPPPTIEEQFRRFYADRHGGVPPAPELVRLFLELVESEEEEKTA